MMRRTRQRSRYVPRSLLYALVAVLSIACAALVIASPRPAKMAEGYWGAPEFGRSPIAAPDLPPVKVFGPSLIPYLGLHPWAKYGEWNPERRLATIAAFMQMGVPRGAAEKGVRAMEHDTPHDVLEVSNAGAVGRSGETYGPIFDTCYQSVANGRVVTLGSQLDFADKKRKTTALVWKIDGYVFGEFMDCSNCTLFKVGKPLSPLERSVRSVPEPSVLWLMLAGLVGLVWSARQVSMPSLFDAMEADAAQE